MIEVAIIAGGEGTRIRNFLGDMPKSLMQINSKSLIEIQIDFFRSYNIENFHFFLGSGHQQIIDFLNHKYPSSPNFNFYIENNKQGTGGNFLAHFSNFKHNLLVTYGDLYVDFPLQHLVNVFASDDIDFAQLVHPSNHLFDSDIVEVDERSRILRIHSKPHTNIGQLRNLCNAGVYFFRKTIFEHFQDSNLISESAEIDLDRQLIQKFIDQGFKGYSVRNIGVVRDLGTPERMKRFLSNQPIPNDYERPLVILDRDGVLNVDKGWIKNISEFKIYDDVCDSLKRLNEIGVRVVVATNQPVVARGECTMKDIESIHAYLDGVLAERNVYIDHYYVCPHHPDRGFPGEVNELKIDCDCRKPKIGMIESARRDFPVKENFIWFLGDSENDLLAAKRSGISFLRINRDRSLPLIEDFDYLEFTDLVSAVDYICSDLESGKLYNS